MSIYILASIGLNYLTFLIVFGYVKMMGYIPVFLSVWNFQIVVIAEIAKYLIILILYYKIAKESSFEFNMILPAFSGISILITENKLLWHGGRVSDRMTVVLIILILNIISFAIIVSKNIAHRKHLELDANRQENIYKEKYFQEVEDSQFEIKRVRDDLKKQLLALKEKEDSKYLKEELSNLINNMTDSEDNYYYTANKGIDIIKAKEYIAKSIGIGWDAKVSIPYKIGIENIDMGILLGNTFDNAIEACKRMKGENRYIKTLLVYSHKTLIIRIENSIEGEVDINSTQKEDKINHGIGLNSVEQVVNKYNGKIYYDITDSIFTIQIMIHEI